MTASRDERLAGAGFRQLHLTAKGDTRTRCGLPTTGKRSRTSASGPRDVVVCVDCVERMLEAKAVTR